jgi:L-fuconolactonase
VASRKAALVPVIDTHCHVWRIELLRRAWRAPDKIYRTFRVSDLLSSAGKVPLAGVILIEAGTTDEDNRWLAAVASRNPRVLGFVTYADPLDDHLKERLDRWRDAAKFRGVRFRLEGIHDAGFPATKRFADALRLIRERELVVELLIEPRHMRPLARALAKIQDVKAVIEHLAKPSMNAGSGSRQRSKWQEGMRALAHGPSTFCKVSISLRAEELAKQPGLAGRLNDIELVRGYMRYALEQFGSTRCCWGSDWPLSNLIADYETVLSTARAALQPLSARDEGEVFHATAAMVYSK